MKKLLKTKMVWFPVWMPLLLMLSMISIYLPVFKGADQKLTDFPLIIVNEDQNFAPSINGKEVFENLKRNHEGHSLKWMAETSKEKAIKDIKENKAYGAIVIPADYTSGMAKIQEALLTGKVAAKPVQVEVLINEGGGQLATSVASGVLQGMISQTTASISSQLQADMIKAKKQVSPQAVSLINHPIIVKNSNVLGLPGDLNKGLTPFMLVLVASITAFMGTQMIEGYLGGIVEKKRAWGQFITETTSQITSVVLGIILMVVTASALMVIVFGFFNSAHSVGVWSIWLYLILCILTLFFMFKMLSLIFGKWGMLVMFPINILGIFASGGPIPLTGLPEFHRFFSEFLPARYMVDGMRSLLYFDGNTEAGLGTALWVVFSCFVVFTGICLLHTYHTYKKEKASGGGEPVNSISEEAVNAPLTQEDDSTAITPLRDQSSTHEEEFHQALVKFVEAESTDSSHTANGDAFRKALLSLNER